MDSSVMGLLSDFGRRIVKTVPIMTTPMIRWNQASSIVTPMIEPATAPGRAQKVNCMLCLNEDGDTVGTVRHRAVEPHEDEGGKREGRAAARHHGGKSRDDTNAQEHEEIAD